LVNPQIHNLINLICNLKAGGYSKKEKVKRSMKNLVKFSVFESWWQI